jgi:hypothetical protein
MGTSIRALGGMFGTAKSARHALVPGLTGTADAVAPLGSDQPSATPGVTGGMLGAMFARARVRANVTKRPGVATTYTRPPTGGTY